MKLEDLTRYSQAISIDSRTIKKGDLFVAIKGKRFDGHDFIKAAFKKGAGAALVSRKAPARYSNKYSLVRVENTVRALGELARLHRMKFKVPVVAITGSSGKTTAKDMIAFVLSRRYSVLASESSKNNLIGLPLTLLGLNETHHIVVLEMGMNHLGEIDRLCSIAEPHIGVVTNIGPSHLEHLGTVRNVFRAKSELLKRLDKGDTVFLNGDDNFLRKPGRMKCNCVYFGIDKSCKFRAENIHHERGKWNFSLGKQMNFELGLLGKHNIYNALSAICVGVHFGIDLATIVKRIRAFRPIQPKRLELKKIGGIQVIDDSYNSNPPSMRRAIEVLSAYKTRGRRIALCGDMGELGKRTGYMHRAIGGLIGGSSVDTLITSGDLSRLMGEEARKSGAKDTYHAKSHIDARNILRRVAKPGDVVLIKGSRAMEMERVIEKLRQ